MRAVIQNVKDCYLRIDNEVFSSIDSGFLILISFTQWDDLNLAKKFIDKIITLRVFPDENGKTNLSLKDINGQIMCVSQFTLYADVAKGRRPSFVNALAFDKASILYDEFCEELENQFGKISRGQFGADMKISFTNDGPFTLMLDSKEMWGM